MKKCGIILSLLLLITLNSCNKATNGSNSADGYNNSATNNATATAQPLCEPIVNICDTLPLDNYTANSPTLSYSIILSPIKLSNSAATQKAISTISYSLSGTECDDLSAAAELYAQKLTSEYKELRPEFINIRENYKDSFWPNHEHKVISQSEESRNGYINYTLSYYEYQGGAHPNSYLTTFVFDANSGNEITLDNIMKEGYEDPLLTIITQELMSHFEATSIEELNQRIFSDTDLFISKNILINKETITFIYNRYEIAPYSAGEITLNIPYEKLKDLLK